MRKALLLIAPLVPALVVLLLPGTAQASTYEAQSHSGLAVSATVRSGDTAWAIAARLCGQGALHATLTFRSPAGVPRTNHDRIWPGDRVSGSCTTVRPAPATASRSAVRATGWANPLPGTLTCVSGWGAPRTGHTHKGIDLPKPSGTPIYAIHAGKVSVNKWSSGGGWYVMVDGGTYQSVYMHQRVRSPLAVGTSVRAGQRIGTVGSTGDSSGPHLHLEVHKGAWHPFNPAPFLRGVGVPVRGC